MVEIRSLTIVEHDLIEKEKPNVNISVVNISVVKPVNQHNI